MITGFSFSKPTNGVLIGDSRTVGIVRLGCLWLPNLNASEYPIIEGSGEVKPLTGVYARYRSSGDGVVTLSTSPGDSVNSPFWVVMFDTAQVQFVSSTFKQTTGLMSSDGYMYDLVADSASKNASTGMIRFTNLRLVKRTDPFSESAFNPDFAAESQYSYSLLFGSDSNASSHMAVQEIEPLINQALVDTAIESSLFDSKLEEATSTSVEEKFKEIEQRYIAL